MTTEQPTSGRKKGRPSAIKTGSHRSTAASQNRSRANSITSEEQGSPGVKGTLVVPDLSFSRQVSPLTPGPPASVEVDAAMEARLMQRLAMRMDQVIDARLDSLITTRLDGHFDARIDSRINEKLESLLKERMTIKSQPGAETENVEGSAVDAESPAETTKRIAAMLQSGLAEQDGKISASKLASVLRKFGGRSWTDDNVQKIFKAVEGDCGGDTIDINRFVSWLFGSKLPQEAEQMSRSSAGLDALEAMEALQGSQGSGAEKRKRSKQRQTEKRVHKYEVQEGERLYRPQSHLNGTLLLRPDGSFSYVHDDTARFSEGVQGQWIQQPGNKVRLEPTAFGWCYEETFDANEIIGVCHSVTLTSDPADSNGRLTCTLANELCVRCSWLDPTLPDKAEAYNSKVMTDYPMQEDCPNSPKITRRKKNKEKDVDPISPMVAEDKRRHPERRVHKYQAEHGERLYRPQSHLNGMLLLRPDGSFSYVHDDLARFSEGVQGQWVQQLGSDVRLEPTSFGWCYEESFDANEIVGVCHSVTLSTTLADDHGRFVCVLPDELCVKFSWLDPTLPEVMGSVSSAGLVGGSGREVLEEECPNSPKVARNRRKKEQNADETDPISPMVAEDKRRHPERRAHKYQSEPGENLYRPQTHLNGMLLLRPGGSFSYVHDDMARFSEGVQGQWVQLGSEVRLEPTSFGWCYEESFDANEIIGVCHSVSLSTTLADEHGRFLCVFPDKLCVAFSWLDPTLPEVRETLTTEVEDECPNSPKIARNVRRKENKVEEADPSSPLVSDDKRRHPERRAHKYRAEPGERLYRPQSHQNGILLLRPDGSFGYVHDDMARFSEGVQGQWIQHLGAEVRLEPTSFGWCYAESFDADEIVGVFQIVTLSSDQADDNGSLFCFLPHDLCVRFSWLDPTLPEFGGSTSKPANAAEMATQLLEDECPNSPKATRKPKTKDNRAGGQSWEADPISPMVAEEKRRHPEKRVQKYQSLAGEQLYRPRSHQNGTLLLRPDGSFSYVHDDTARFSEGVQGLWSQQNGCEVRLEPTSFGWCYAESFDVNEILGVHHTVSLSTDQADENGRLFCILPDELCARFSWLDPTLPEITEATSEEVEDECPNSPKVLRARKNWMSEDTDPSSPLIAQEKRRYQPDRRAHKYQAEPGERLYRPQSRPNGVLLLRPDGSFAYVHDDMARFSEGVQGVWMEQPSDYVKLEPTSFGWCYEESFDSNEIIGVFQSIKLLSESTDENGNQTCVFPAHLCVGFSWLDPSLPESTEAVEQEELDDECPNSPKVVRNRKGRQTQEFDPSSPMIAEEKRRSHQNSRAHKYEAEPGERLYRPQSHPNGVLLLRPDGSFAYVHDDIARFSEGVQGKWTEEHGNKVRLEPTAFGWCYEESFDVNEIIGVCHSVTLSTDEIAGSGRLSCIFPDKLTSCFSWLDPTLQEEPSDIFSSEAAATSNTMIEDEDLCPNSPKVFRKRRS